MFEPGSDSEGRLRFVLIGLIVGLLAFLNRAALVDLVRGGPNAEPRPVAPRGDLADDEKTTIAIFEVASQSVVHVTTIGTRYQWSRFGLEPIEIPEGTGSGIIWDSDGHVVTNYHVIESIYRSSGVCQVRLKDSSEAYEAKIVGVAGDKDLAVLRIQADRSKLRPILVGTSADLKVGQNVFAIGNPFGLDQTLTRGIVSALDRQIQAKTGRTIQNVIQTDSAINPGNSGGPLLDSAGRLIGLNTAIRADAQNLGFAVAVDTVNEVVPQLIRYGGFRPGLASVQFVPDGWARKMGISHGVIVRSVEPGSTPHKAGLRGPRQVSQDAIEFDLIVQVDGMPVPNTQALNEEIEKHKVGDTVELTVERGGRRLALSVPLEATES